MQFNVIAFFLNPLVLLFLTMALGEPVRRTEIPEIQIRDHRDLVRRPGHRLLPDPICCHHHQGQQVFCFRHQDHAREDHRWLSDEPGPADLHRGYRPAGCQGHEIRHQQIRKTVCGAGHFHSFCRGSGLLWVFSGSRQPESVPDHRHLHRGSYQFGGSGCRYGVF